MEVRPRNPGRDDEQLCIGAVQERQQVLALRLLAARTGSARAARRRVGCDDTPAGGDLGPAELVPEERGQLREQQGVSATERLEIGAVGERNVDLDEDVARAGPWIGHVLDAQVARPVEARCPHGTNTTFSASRRRNRSTPSTKRASGRTTGSGTSSSGSSAAATRMPSGVAERDPTTVSSRR